MDIIHKSICSLILRMYEHCVSCMPGSLLHAT